MFGKIAIRNIPTAIWEGLETLASQHDRSTEAEARHALRTWVEPLMHRNERSARRVEVSARLRDLLEQVNKAIHGSAIKPSHIAQEIGESKAENAEKWFTGEEEPSFKQLEAVASYLGGSSAWLQHGDRQMFDVESTRIPERATEGVTWLLDLDREEQIRYLHIVRENDETGSLVIIKQYNDWRCKIYTTPYHISEVIGAGGEASLANLSVIFELLYEYYTKRGGSATIKSYLVSKEDFKKLIEGKSHPLSIIRNNNDIPWWEDFWDITQFRKQGYWSGWKSVCERIYRVIELKPPLQEERELIKSGQHPLLLLRLTGDF